MWKFDHDQANSHRAIKESFGVEECWPYMNDVRFTSSRERKGQKTAYHFEFYPCIHPNNECGLFLCSIERDWMSSISQEKLLKLKFYCRDFDVMGWEALLLLQKAKHFGIAYQIYLLLGHLPTFLEFSPLFVVSKTVNKNHYNCYFRYWLLWTSYYDSRKEISPYKSSVLVAYIQNPHKVPNIEILVVSYDIP